jgi:hypothetical protein
MPQDPGLSRWDFPVSGCTSFDALEGSRGRQRALEGDLRTAHWPTVPQVRGTFTST